MATHSTTGKELDGGGHRFGDGEASEAEAKAKAIRQLGHIDKWQAKQDLNALIAERPSRD